MWQFFWPRCILSEQSKSLCSIASFLRFDVSKVDDFGLVCPQPATVILSPQGTWPKHWTSYNKSTGTQ